MAKTLDRETIDPACEPGETITRRGLEWAHNANRIEITYFSSSGVAAKGLVPSYADVLHLSYVPYQPNSAGALFVNPARCAMDALHWRVLEFIADHAGKRVEQIAEALGIQDLLAFEIVDELRAKGLVGPA